MSYTLEKTTVEVDGLTFKVEIKQDEDYGRPWDESDGHGPVREAKRNYHYGRIEKAHGERILHAGDSNEYSWVYDWNGALKLAEKDGWGVSEKDRPANWDSLSRAQQSELAVQRDFEFLKAWCDENWVCCGVCVTLMIEDEDGDLVEYDGPLTAQFHDSLWGVEYWQYDKLESEENSHVNETIQELCGGMAEIYVKEAAEKLHWAERDVVTA